MRLLMCVLLITAISSFASVRTGGSGMPNPWASNGTYSILDQMAGGLTSSYGLAIKDNEANSIWILNWSDMLNYEFNMSSGAATGNSLPISGGVDPDDQSFCEYSGGNQWFMSDYALSFVAIFEEDGTFLRNLDGPSSMSKIFGVGAGHDMLYVGGAVEGELGWASYTGTETTTTWTTMAYESVYGLAVSGDYLFVACGIEFADNIFIHSIAADGTPSATPVWSCSFLESSDGTANGGIDYDGTNLWVYPQNDFLYKLDIDFDPGALESDTWAAIKTSF